MGVITIEVPQKVNRKYRIDSKESAQDVMTRLDRIVKDSSETTKGKSIDLSDVVGLWADRPESADEIARKLRQRSNSRLKNG